MFAHRPDDYTRRAREVIGKTAPDQLLRAVHNPDSYDFSDIISTVSRLPTNRDSLVVDIASRHIFGIHWEKHLFSD